MGTVILDHVSRCYTSEDGEVIFHVLLRALREHDKVTVSFKGVGDVPSSFVNTAFVPLLDHYSIEYLRDHLGITDSNSQINDMIRHRMLFSAKRKVAATA